jgi:hypothetical protein
MLLERVILYSGAILLIGAAGASAQEPMALTRGELDSITALRVVPDLLNRLRITVEGETEDSDRGPVVMIAEEIEESRLLLVADPPSSAPADIQSTTAATLAASGGNDAGSSWTGTDPSAYTDSWTSGGSSTWTGSSTAGKRIETGSSSSAANDVSRSRNSGWSSPPAVASNADHLRAPDGRAGTGGISIPAARHWGAVAQIRADTGRVLHRLGVQAAAARP